MQMSTKNSSKLLLFEVCVDNLRSAIEAEKGGAKRLELCCALSEGGLTPSYGFLKVVKRSVSIPVFVMIRPRGGDFLYDASEIEIMKEDIKIFNDLGADGFVFGCLNKDGKIDVTNCFQLANVCRGKPMTFHRAFDLTSEDPIQALENIIQMGFSRILTSGQAVSALQGEETIRKLVESADGRIVIMPGAGITEENIREIIKETGAIEFHGSARKTILSSMYESASSSRDISMGKDDATTLQVTDSEIVEKILQNAALT